MFIYQHLPEREGAPKLERGARRPQAAKEGLADSPEGLLQQLQFLQNEYDLAMAAADELEQKLNDAKSLLEQLGKNSTAGKLIAAAIAKSEQAKMALDQSAYRAALLEAIEEVSLKIYQATLLKAGMGKDGAENLELVKRIRAAEKDPALIVALWKEAKVANLGVSLVHLGFMEEALSAQGGAGPILKIISELRKLKLSNYEIGQFVVLKARLALPEVKNAVASMKNAGLKEGFANCYFLHKEFGGQLNAVISIVIKLQAAGIDQYYLLAEIFTSLRGRGAPTLDEFLQRKEKYMQALLDAGFFNNTAISILTARGCNDAAIKYFCEIKPFVEHKMADGAFFKELRDTCPDINAAKKLCGLIKEGFVPSQVLALASLAKAQSGAPIGQLVGMIIAFFLSLKRAGLSFPYTTAWFLQEKDPAKVLEYEAHLKTLPKMKTPGDELHKLFPNARQISKGLVLGAFDLMKRTGIGEVEALYVLCSDEFFACHTNPDYRQPGFEKSLQILKKHKYSNSDAVAIWGICRGYNGSPSTAELLATAEEVDEGAKDGADKSLLLYFLAKCQQTTLPHSLIVSFWKYNHFLPLDSIADVVGYLQDQSFNWNKAVPCAAAIYNRTLTRPLSVPLAKYMLEKSDLTENDQMARFLADPALPYCEALIKAGVPPREALMYGRNFWFAKAPLATVSSLTFSDLRREAQKILAAQEKVKNISIFRGRNVVCLKEREIFNGRDRFMTAEMQQAIQVSMGIDGVHNPEAQLKVCDTGKFNDTQAEREKVGKEFLALIVDTPPPATFIPECHGGPDGLRQFGITTQDLVGAFAARSALWSSTALKEKLAEDIFATGSCYSHVVARAQMEKCENGPMPIFIVAPEYGGMGFTAQGKGNFIYSVLGAGEADPKIARVIKAEKMYQGSDVSIYCKDASGVATQIGKNESGRQRDDKRQAPAT